MFIYFNTVPFIMPIQACNMTRYSKDETLLSHLKNVRNQNEDEVYHLLGHFHIIVPQSRNTSHNWSLTIVKRCLSVIGKGINTHSSTHHTISAQLSPQQ